MMERIAERRRGESEGGFTLIELLVVIIILGILAAVVVFAVGGVGDKGQAAACKIDTRTLRTSLEAYSAQTSPPGGNGNYVASTNVSGTIPNQTRTDPAASADETALVTGGFLSESSKYHYVSDVVAANPSTNTLATFKIRIDKDGATVCGAAADTVVGTGGAL